MADVSRLALDLMDPSRSRSTVVARTLDTASARMLYHTKSIFEYATDSAETDIRIGRHLVERAYDPNLRPQFTHATKLGERLEIVGIVIKLGSSRALNNSLFSPTADGALAEAEQLFDFPN